MRSWRWRMQPRKFNLVNYKYKSLEIRNAALHNWRKSEFSNIKENWLMNMLNLWISENISRRFENRKRLRNSSDKLLRRLVVILRASGKFLSNKVFFLSKWFLVILSKIRKIKRSLKIHQLMKPLMQTNQIKEILNRAREKKQLGTPPTDSHSDLEL